MNKKFFLIYLKKSALIFSLVFFNNCIGDDHYHYYGQGGPKNDNTFDSRPSGKYSRRLRPSESMQVGAEENYNYQKSAHLEDEDDFHIDFSHEYKKVGSANESVFTVQEQEADDRFQMDHPQVVTDDISTTKASKLAYPKNLRKYRGYFKIGSPYKIFGVPYTPQNYEEYEEIGTASWYGPAFNGKLTANGEIYNMDSMTAAHPTLPLPSLAKVTNLANGRSVVVRINDRGPFAKNRLIDVSRKAAGILGFSDRGTTKVKVKLLRKDTDVLLAALNLKE